MIPKTIDNLILVNFHDYSADQKNYDSAFEFTVKHLMPEAKKIHILYNGIEFNYFDEAEMKEVRYEPASYLDLIKHFKKYGVHSLTKTPRIIVDNAITPLTKKIYIYPKTFGYSKPWKSTGASDADIVRGLLNIIDNELDVVERDGQPLTFPDWFFDLDDNIGDEEECVVVGGPKNDCIKELIYILEIMRIPYNKHKDGIF